MRPVKIGLEIHGYLALDTKLFCDCRIDRKASPNTTICPVCTGQPGANPMAPSAAALEKVYTVALMLGAHIQDRLLFQRKHYSWPDLPCGYQKTMSGAYSTPTAVSGEFLGIGIEELHLEEDPAKWDPLTGCVDYNRSGYPLVEIVTKPDFESAPHVEEWLRRLLTTLSYIRAIDKAAGIKCDVNVSVAPDFVRTEIKNVNSVAAIAQAIDHETARLRSEGSHRPHTRTWDERLQETVFMRLKETQEEYMFIPDPDLAVIRPPAELLATLHAALPEPPAARLARYRALGVDAVDAQVISSEIVLADLFDQVIAEVEPAYAAHWFRLLQRGAITAPIAKDILAKWVGENFDIDSYVKERGLAARADEAQLAAWCDEAIAANPKAVEEVKAGRAKALNALVGAVLKKSGGKADPAAVKALVEARL